MDAADVKALLGEIVVTLLGAALIALAAYWVGRGDGIDIERAKCLKAVAAAVAAARQTETDLVAIDRRRAAEWSAKEREQEERERERNAEWARLRAGLPDCHLPARIGVQLDAAARVPAAPAVAEPPRSDPDAGALDAVVGLADTLDRVRDNYAICARNVERLTEARAWYDEIRNRFEGAPR